MLFALFSSRLVLCFGRLPSVPTLVLHFSPCSSATSFVWFPPRLSILAHASASNCSSFSAVFPRSPFALPGSRLSFHSLRFLSLLFNLLILPQITISNLVRLLSLRLHGKDSIKSRLSFLFPSRFFACSPLSSLIEPLIRILILYAEGPRFSTFPNTSTPTPLSSIHFLTSPISPRFPRCP